MIKGSDGEYQKLELVDFPDFTENYSTVPTDGEMGGGIKYHLTPTEIEGRFTFTLKYPKRMRCKSRKRYVKLLMSRGVSRNSANRLADELRNLNQAFDLDFSYQSMWNNDFWIFPNITEVPNVH